MGTTELGMSDGSGGKGVAEIARDCNSAVCGEVGGSLSSRTKAGGYPDPQVKTGLGLSAHNILWEKKKDCMPDGAGHTGLRQIEAGRG